MVEPQRHFLFSVPPGEFSMDISAHIRRVSDTAQPLSMHNLTAFSHLDQQCTAQVQHAWATIHPERRLAIVQGMRLLAEDAVELDFRTIFLFCLDDTEPSVRMVAIDGLWEDEKVQTLRRLLDMVSDPSGDVREAAMISLSRFAYLAAVGDHLPAEDVSLLYQTLLRVVLDEAGQPLHVRRRALESAGYFASSSDVRAQIRRAYDDFDQQMRESALVAMGRSMLPEWLPSIQDELESDVPSLRYEAARAMGEMGEICRNSLGALLPLIHDEDVQVAQATIWALGQIGGTKARQALQRLADDEDTQLAQAASEALEELLLDDW